MKNIFIITLLVLTIKTYVSGFAGGNGTLMNPYQVATVADFLAINYRLTNGHSRDCYILVNDLDFNGATYSKALIVPDLINGDDMVTYYPFEGTFNGNNFAIRNLNLDPGDTGNDNVALFGLVSFLGKVCNLNMYNCHLKCEAGICAVNEGFIDNCHFNGTIDASNVNSPIGAICGCNNLGIIIDCSSNCMINNAGFAIGGICGQNDKGDIFNCLFDGQINAADGAYYIGGICGYNQGCILGAIFRGDIISGDNIEIAGGIAGANVNTASISFSNFYGEIQCGLDCKSIGGIAGYNDRYEIRDCSSQGIIGLGDNSEIAGGVTGLNLGQVINCSFGGEIWGPRARTIGGICGAIIAGDEGEIYSYTYQCRTSSTANITGEERIGGICGFSEEARIIESYSLGHVIGLINVGGICGKLSDSLCYNSYSNALIAGGNYLGGITGTIENNSNIQNCYTAGLVNMFGNIEAVGYDIDGSSTINNSFWIAQMPDVVSDYGGISKTAEQMKFSKTFTDAGWDFRGEEINGDEGTWALPHSGFPILSWDICNMGDRNNNNVIDPDDLLYFASNWLSDHEDSDFNSDKIVNMTDLVKITNLWGI